MTGIIPMTIAGTGGSRPRQHTPDEQRFTFGIGARGFLVAQLQEALGIAADGVFGRGTASRINHLQVAHGLSITGCAGALEFGAVGLNWPTEFERCMNLAACFEGTSFGDCNSIDIDGAGLTMGIAGFTSGHGEVQVLLAQYLAARPDALDELLPRPEHELLALHLAGRTAHAAWRSLFYDAAGKVKPCWQQAIAVFGRDPFMRQLQLALAESRFWQPAVTAAARLGFTSLQARCFFLDVAVQNGGWRRQHEKAAQAEPAWKSGVESARLAVAARAVARCAKPRWQADVLSRKLTIASGIGRVHGRHYQVRAFAICYRTEPNSGPMPGPR